MDRALKKSCINKTIGRNILLEREYRRLSRDELATILGVSTAHMGLMERGERGVHVLHLNTLSEIFKVPIAEFFTSNNEDDVKGLENDARRDAIFTLTAGLDESELDYVADMIKGLLEMKSEK